MIKTSLIFASLASVAFAASSVTSACQSAYDDFFNQAVLPCFWNDTKLAEYGEFGALLGAAWSNSLTMQQQLAILTTMPRVCTEIKTCLNTPRIAYGGKTALDAVNAYSHHCASQRSVSLCIFCKV